MAKPFISNLILNKYEFYLSAATAKRYQCTQQYLQTNMGNSIPNAPSRLRRSEKNYQVVKKQSYQRKIELENKGNNEHSRFT